MVFSSSRQDLAGSVPLDLELFCLDVPFINGGGYRVHRVDATYECKVESPGKEGDKDSLVDYPTEVGGDFELINIGEDFVFGLCNGLEVGKGFRLEVDGEEGFSKGVFEVGEGSKLLVVNGIEGEGYCPF